MNQEACLQDHSYDPYGVLSATFGFVPRLFEAQSIVPRVLEGEARLIDVVVGGEQGLSRSQKNQLLQAVACSRQNAYCLALCSETSAIPSEQDSVLRAFAVTLACRGPWFSPGHIERLREAGFHDPKILDAVLTTALAQWLCTLADGLNPTLDSCLKPRDLSEVQQPFPCIEAPDHSRPYLHSLPQSSNDFQPFVFLREEFGFVPNVFRLQTLRPDVLEEEIKAIKLILLGEELLNRIQKEYILLALSAANLSTYWVAFHSEVLSILGVAPEDSDQIALDHRSADIAEADKALLDCVLALALHTPTGSRLDPQSLRLHGFTEAQILEAVAVCGINNFLDTLQTGLGAVSDFPARRVFAPRKLYPEAGSDRPIVVVDSPPPDPDGELVVRVQAGDSDAFEELARRHARRIFATLVGLLGDREEARDAMQDVFLKAFQHIAKFQGRSKFSTWLTRIAINTGTEALRQRRGTESLDDLGDDEGFRPRQVQSWAEDPEQLLAAAQIRDLVLTAVHRLPYKYRVAVILRDINQLSTEEAAAGLDLKVPALKARLLRGRLMLREALAPHFIDPGAKT